MTYFGSDALAEAVQTALTALPAVTGALADGAGGVVGSTTAPSPANPVLIHYPLSLPYPERPINANAAPEFQTGTYVVRLIVEGWSDQPIKAASDAMFAALDGLDATIDGVRAQMSAAEEWTNRSYDETVGGVSVHIRERGTIFNALVTFP